MNRKRRRRYEFVRKPMQSRGTEGVEVSCAGKIRWWDKESADKHAVEVNQRLIGDRPVRAYRCRINPNEWHTGRMKPKT